MRALALSLERLLRMLMLGLVILQLMKFFANLVFVSRFQEKNNFGDLGKKKIARGLCREGGNGICSNRKEWCLLMKQ